MKTPCACTKSGFCERHACFKTAHYVRLCQTRLDYFQAWEEGRGPCCEAAPPDSGTVVDSTTATTQPPAPVRRGACVFLGPVLSETDSNGTPCRCHWKWLRRCEIHGECATGDTRRAHSCNVCSDYESA